MLRRALLAVYPCRAEVCAVRPFQQRPFLLSRAFTEKHKPVPLDAEVLPQKSSTGLPCVPVVPRARAILIRIYERYVDMLEQFEASTPYRAHMEKVTRARLAILLSTEDVFEIEERIGCGQIEELIELAENEMRLAPFMLEHQPWKTNDRWHRPFMLYSDVK